MDADRSELDALVSRYPAVFADGNDFGGFSLHAGWAKLLDTLCARLETILSESPATRIHILQIKEKFGMLRFYYSLDGADEDTMRAIREAVHLAEEASGQLCEWCGDPGSMDDTSGWLVTLCEPCQTKRREMQKA